MCQLMVVCTKTVVIYKYRVPLMLTRKGLYLGDRPPDTKCMWEVILYNGRARNTHPNIDLGLKVSTELWLTQLVGWFG